MDTKRRTPARKRAAYVGAYLATEQKEKLLAAAQLAGLTVSDVLGLAADHADRLIATVAAPLPDADGRTA